MKQWFRSKHNHMLVKPDLNPIEYLLNDFEIAVIKWCPFNLTGLSSQRGIGKNLYLICVSI